MAGIISNVDSDVQKLRKLQERDRKCQKSIDGY